MIEKVAGTFPEWMAAAADKEVGKYFTATEPQNLVAAKTLNKTRTLEVQRAASEPE